MAVQRRQRNFAGGSAHDTYLDLLVDPALLAGLPPRPLVHAGRFGELTHAGHGVSWDETHVRVALPSLRLEADPVVNRALRALEARGVPVLPPRTEFWPTGFSMLVHGGNKVDADSKLGIRQASE